MLIGDSGATGEFVLGFFIAFGLGGLVGGTACFFVLQRKLLLQRSALEEEKISFRQTLTTLQQTNSELRENLSACENAKNQYLQLSSAQSATITQLQERLQQTQSALQTLSETCNSSQQRILELEKQRTELTTRLEEQTRLHQTLTAHLQQSHEQLQQGFHALAAEALKTNASNFLQQTQKQLEPLAVLLEQLRQTLQTTREQFGKDSSSLRQHLELLQQAQSELQRQTQNLATALRRPEVRGSWGEIQLRRVIELSGMLPHCDFVEQPTLPTSDTTRLRPDVIVHLPGGQNIVVDAKTPLDAYLAALNATTEEERRTHLARHARQLREKVQQLSSRSYAEQLSQSPEFVVLFIPNEASFQTALEQEPGLIEQAAQERVLLATPITLIALLKAAAYGWRQVEVQKNAEAIRDTAVEIYRSLCVFLSHLQRVGEQLTRAVRSYNDSVGSLERNVLPKTRRLQDLGIPTEQPPQEKDLRIEISPRPINAPELTASQMLLASEPPPRETTQP